MADRSSGLPAVRAEDVWTVAQRVMHVVQDLARTEPQGEPQVRGGLARLDRLRDETKAQLVAATYERNRLDLRIADAVRAERELMRIAAPFAARGGEVSDLPPAVRTALRRAVRLSEDIAEWKEGLEEAEETVRLCRDLDAVVRKSRVDLERVLDSLARRFRAAETKSALARIADQLGAFDRAVRVDLAERVRDAEARAAAEHETALNDEDVQLRQLAAAGEDAAVEERLRRLRQDTD
ncbi:hypothetical protein GCM10018785_75050 [Streptomyces longispororuber]|uniref:Uncharacterized protein n=1 Tax=Streptomyces longispororuber TaxID=68230 RepID=A0A919E187_9ACTN|nr:hypothetical protein [Streptomyces longispororuber]GHF01387.1 hypothetical protein GCM10018785_75050 [Streptomyces longispororuber]